MSKIRDYILKINLQNKKALSIFLTAGFPDKTNFADLAVEILDNGADMLEIGIPFSDPIADGSVIQHSSQAALENGVRLQDVFNYTQKIKAKSNKPVILMGYANPLLKFGTKEFISQSIDSGVDGLIIPDIPIEEYDGFWNESLTGIDNILLATPASSAERILRIDQKSSGFVYCVSVTGTTGSQLQFSPEMMQNLKRTYELVKKNKMLIGFGISNAETVKSLSAYCDGFIAGSAVIKKLINKTDRRFKETISLVQSLAEAAHF
jgi:tryptophan synthase alpha chain